MTATPLMAVLGLVLVLVCLLMYVVLDGYDLGVGVGILIERDPGHRRRMLESVAVGWDGNETWLILLGVTLWSAFPLAFGTLLPHAYLPLVVLLLGLIVRGVSVEMASQTPQGHRWTTAFGVGSLLAAFSQGFVLGTLTSPLHQVGDAFSGPTFGAFGIFPVLSGLTVVATYTALGYAYTKQKTVGRLREAAARRGRVATAVTAGLVLAVLVAISTTATPLNLAGPQRAFTFGVLLLFAAAGVVASLVTFGWRQQSGAADTVPIAGLSVAVVALVLALLAARYPVIVPPDLTIYDKVSPSSTMNFVLIAIALLNMPLVLAYNVFAHRAFRGKLETEPPVDEQPAGNGHVAAADGHVVSGAQS
jgi:cytochrome bd ubiquinol oxidase subunit II